MDTMDPQAMGPALSERARQVIEWAADLREQLADFDQWVRGAQLTGDEIGAILAVFAGIDGGRNRPGTKGVKHEVDALTDHLVALLAAAGHGGRVGEWRFYPYQRDAKVKTDGKRLVSVLTEKAVANGVDPTTGELSGPVHQLVAEALTRCGGLDTPSHKGWLKGELESFGIALDAYRESEPGSWTVGWEHLADAARRRDGKRRKKAHDAPADQAGDAAA